MNQALVHYGRLLRQRWRWWLWGGLTGLLISAAVLLAWPPMYRTDARVFVRTPGDISRVVDGGEDYAQKQAETYAALARGAGLSKQVAADLGLGISPETLAARVTAQHLPGTALIEMSVEAPSSAESRRTAEVLLSEFVSTVRSLESIPGSLIPRAELVVVDPPGTPVRVAPWGTRLYLGLVGAVLLGVFAGALTAVLESLIKPATQSVER